jgi:hypothetical protein
VFDKIIIYPQPFSTITQEYQGEFNPEWNFWCFPGKFSSFSNEMTT